jgi:beta-galactosidase GanA
MKTVKLFWLFAVMILFSANVSAKHSGGDVNRLFILGGELSNSAATSVADIDEVMPRMAALGLNTVLVPAYWDLIEPVEGKYDWTLVDRVIQQNQKK